MFGSKTLSRHAGLVNSMAATIGVDLPGAVADGRVAGEAIRSAVLRCTACDQPEACAHWLEAHGEGADAVPGYCRNATFFATFGDAEE